MPKITVLNRPWHSYVDKTRLQRIQQILHQDPVWAVYPLADLQPAFAPYCQWGLAEEEAGSGVAMLFTALSPSVLFLMGPNPLVAKALAQLSLPAEIYLNLRAEQVPLLSSRYTIGEKIHPMWRMVLTTSTSEWPAHPGVVRLQASDSDAIRQLLAHGGPFTPDAFDPYQLDDGVFFGIRTEDGELATVGGTHIIDRDHQAAAIGNMYTHPAHRGRGHGGAVLGAIVHTLRSQRIERILLNVDQQNPTARRLYEKHGFQVQLSYIEGICQRAGATKIPANGP